MKKTLVLATIVIGLHCLVISALFLAQGCKTTKGKSTTSTSTTAPMPPLSAPVTTEPSPVLPKEPAISSEETSEYVVKSGDSLGSIAKKHNVSKSELIELNKIADPNKIRAGQKLVIPKHARISSAPAPKVHEAKHETKAKAKKSETTGESALTGTANEYIVQAGDTLSKVSSKLNVKIAELREVNKLANDKLKAGQKLVIPPKKAEGATETVPAKPETTVKPEASPATPAGATAPAAAAPKGTSSGITHVVSPNEDLGAIAKLYAVTVDDIVAANQLGTNRTVQAGQKLVIP